MNKEEMKQAIDSLRQGNEPGSDDELRESLRAYGWVKHFPAICDEQGVVLVGNRRLRLASELGLEPVFKILTIGTGEEADLERVKLAVASNIGGRPLTPADRKRLAIRLYEKGWTQQKIGDALGVARETVRNYLAGLAAPQGLADMAKPSTPILTTRGKPSKADPNRSKGGRPKGSSNAGAKKARNPTEAEEKAIAEEVLDRGKTRKQVEALYDVSNTVIRRAVAAEEGRREVKADPPIDPATLSLSAQAKLTRAIEQHKRQLEAEFQTRVNTRIRELIDSTTLPSYLQEIKSIQDFLERRRGVWTKIEYNKVLRCLHPDHPEVSMQWRREAFDLMQRYKLRLLDNTQEPIEDGAAGMPQSYEEMMRMREATTMRRRAARANQAPARRSV